MVKSCRSEMEMMKSASMRGDITGGVIVREVTEGGCSED